MYPWSSKLLLKFRLGDFVIALFCYYIAIMFSTYFLSQWYSNILWIKIAENLCTLTLCILCQKGAATVGGKKRKFFKNIWQSVLENTCAEVSFLIMFLGALKKETLLQVFSCEFCKIFKNSLLKKILAQMLLERIQI